MPAMVVTEIVVLPLIVTGVIAALDISAILSWQDFSFQYRKASCSFYTR